MDIQKFYKLKVWDIGEEQADNCHGRSDKDGVVLHETVSPDYPGWSDIRGVSEYLDNKDYGIHGIVDYEGNIAWAIGKGNCLFYHTASSGSKGSGNINTRKMGIELISTTPPRHLTRYQKLRWWLRRERQLQNTAKLLATLARAWDFPLEYKDPSLAGVTTHWDVTQRYGVPGGHVDCHPYHKGGYFPVLRLIQYAKAWKALGY